MASVTEDSVLALPLRQRKQIYRLLKAEFDDDVDDDRTVHVKGSDSTQWMGMYGKSAEYYKDGAELMERNMQQLRGRPISAESVQSLPPAGLTAEKEVHVILPSLSADEGEMEKMPGLLHYEERQLYNLFKLKNRACRMIFITSVPIHPSIIKYYVSLLDPEIRDTIDERLLLMSCFDTSHVPLSSKVLARPRMQRKIMGYVKKANASHSSMTCPIPTPLEYNLSEQLCLPINASGTDYQIWGTKSGSRVIFRDCNCPHPFGTYNLAFTVEKLAEEICSLWSRKTDMLRVVVKLNDGFSGKGNAILDLRPVAAQLYSNYRFSPTRKAIKITDDERKEAILREFYNMRFQAEDESWPNFAKRVPVLGCIVEEFIEGQGKQSPSVQGIIRHDGVEIISSHEQVLGGPDGQVFLGCRFPADVAYMSELHRLGNLVSNELRKKGGLDYYSIDFIAVPEKPWDFSSWNLYALEINLRQGGTTHPYETMRLLTGGAYDPDVGVFKSSKGELKYYIASDNIQRKEYKGLLPSDLMSILDENQIGYDRSTQCGAVFHMMGAMSQYGKVGVTCIGNTPEEADEIYDRIVATLNKETGVPGA